MSSVASVNSGLSAAQVQQQLLQQRPVITDGDGDTDGTPKAAATTASNARPLDVYV